MKGLIRNNFFMVYSSLIGMTIFSIVVIITVVVGGILYPQNIQFIVSALITSQFGGFGALSGTAMQKDAASKWSKFELTLPISRTTVIKARYISYMLYALIGFVMAVLSTLALYITTGTLPLERVGYGFAFGAGFALNLPAFMAPLCLIFGADKNEVILFISIGLSLALFAGSGALFALIPMPIPIADGNLVFRVGYIIVSIVLFICSYLLSKYIYSKKEL